MRMTTLLVSIDIAAPSIFASVIVQIDANDPTLSIFGVNGPRKVLLFRTTSNGKYLLYGTDQDVEGGLAGLEPGNASFRHESNGKQLDCHIEGFPRDDLSSDNDFFAPDPKAGKFATSWRLAELPSSDPLAHACKEKGGMKLFCQAVLDDKNKPVGGGAEQLCLGA